MEWRLEQGKEMGASCGTEAGEEVSVVHTILTVLVLYLLNLFISLTHIKLNKPTYTYS